MCEVTSRARVFEGPLGHVCEVTGLGHMCEVIARVCVR